MSVFAAGKGSWDPEVDAAYLPIREVGPGDVVSNIEIEDPRLSGTIVIDLDKFNRIVGIEFIGAGALLGADLKIDSSM